MKTSFFSNEELAEIGFKEIGKNVLLSRKASIYDASRIKLGSNIRIDDFCLLSGNIELGNYIHISAYSALFGGKTGIIMKDFSGLSSRGAIYAESDDYSGDYLTTPMISEEFRHILAGKVIINRHVLIGTGCTVLPGVEIGEGSAVGSMSLVNKSLESWGLYAGIPCKRIKERSKELLKKEQLFLTGISGSN